MATTTAATQREIIDGIDMWVDRTYWTEEMTVAEYVHEVRDYVSDKGKGFTGKTTLAGLIDPAKLARAFYRGNAEAMLEALQEKAINLEWRAWAKRNAAAIQTVVDEHNAWVAEEATKCEDED